MRFNLNLINSRPAPPVLGEIHFENTQYYYIGDEATSLIFSLVISIVRDSVFQFPATPLLSTLYNLAPTMKYISGKREHYPQCKIYFISKKSL